VQGALSGMKVKHSLNTFFTLRMSLKDKILTKLHTP